jgi:hypothetical protein
MEFEKQYRDDELEKIDFEALIYLCACPSQVAAEILRLRDLIGRQSACEETATASSVHPMIAAAAIQAHALLEDCLTQVLAAEGWDRQTLKMPEGLRKRRDDFLTRPLSHGSPGEKDGASSG